MKARMCAVGKAMALSNSSLKRKESVSRPESCIKAILMVSTMPICQPSKNSFPCTWMNRASRPMVAILMKVLTVANPTNPFNHRLNRGPGLREQPLIAAMKPYSFFSCRFLFFDGHVESWCSINQILVAIISHFLHDAQP